MGSVVNREGLRELILPGMLPRRQVMTEVELPKPTAPELRQACRKLVRRRWGLASFPRKGQEHGRAEARLGGEVRQNVVSMKAHRELRANVAFQYHLSSISSWPLAEPRMMLFSSAEKNHQGKLTAEESP